jgi:hypothetical protein
LPKLQHCGVQHFPITVTGAHVLISAESPILRKSDGSPGWVATNRRKGFADERSMRSGAESALPRAALGLASPMEPLPQTGTPGPNLW